jgi:Regulator of ribonuclease activity B
MSEWNARAGAGELVRGLQRDGWDLSLPRYVTHDVSAATEDEAEEVAADLRNAGYVVEVEGYDADRERWELQIREGGMLVVTADSLIAAVAEVKRIVGRRAWLSGLGVATRPEDSVTDGDVSDA